MRAAAAAEVFSTAGEYLPASHGDGQATLLGGHKMAEMDAKVACLITASSAGFPIPSTVAAMMITASSRL
jgi:hypothetical protein